MMNDDYTKKVKKFVNETPVPEDITDIYVTREASKEGDKITDFENIVHGVLQCLCVGRVIKHMPDKVILGYCVEGGEKKTRCFVRFDSPLRPVMGDD